MKLYFHPVSTVSRPVVQFCLDAGIDYEPVVVDLMTGEHLGEAYTKRNPNGQVPTLEDGDFRLTESSAILKYLAEKAGSSAYPRDLKKRARINELMDWFNTGFYRDYGYNLVYPQLFPHHKRPSDEAQQATLAWGKQRAEASLKILNDSYLGDGRKFLCGDEPTIADYFGASLVTSGELCGNTFASYPHVERWLGAMKKLPSWDKANEVFNGFKASLKDKAFVKIA
jgi:glutathione S-transferase